MGKLRIFLFPTKENSVFETTTIDENNTQESMPKSSSATLIQHENVSSSSQPSYPKNEERITNSSFNTPQIYKPSQFTEVEPLAIELLNHHPIIVSLIDIEKSEARRICDFLNGVCFALNGEVKKIEKRVYLFAPSAKK